MDRVAVQDQVRRVRVMVVAVQALGSKVIKVIKAIRVATINSQVRGISSISLDIRVT